MEKIILALNELEKINKAYDIPTDHVERLKQEIQNAKVCTPIIGKFSSGKSALVNTVLGYSKKILKEDITPETAIPAEIVYNDKGDNIVIIGNDGGSKEIPIDGYRKCETDATTDKCARIQLRNRFLEEIPEVMMVDMPGFESGVEVHNKAIDNYLPQSLAYIIVFPADDMIVRSSVGNILKELCLHDMPLCVVITKYDKRNDEFEESFSQLKENLRRFVGDRNIRYCRTSSFTGDAEELKDFLREIQEQSQRILSDSFVEKVIFIADNTENYLKTILNNSQLSESELGEREEKLRRQLSGIESGFTDEQNNFRSEIAECVEAIKNDVQCAMERDESTLVEMAMNNQSIGDRLNGVIRNAVTESVKKHLIPRVKKYLKRVENGIGSENLGDVKISFYYEAEKVNKGILSAVVTVAGGILLGLPILGAILAAVSMLANRMRGKKKREEIKQEIRRKLQTEVFPQVLREVGGAIEIAVAKQIQEINTTIEEEVKSQKEILEKAMSDVRGKIKDEKEKKENLAVDIKADLELIDRIRREL